MDFNIVIAGEAGQGLKTVEAMLTKTFSRHGYYLFSTKDYMSRVRGGHNFMQIRISDQKLEGPDEGIDLLLALNEESVEIHRPQMNEDGTMLSEVESDENDMVYIDAKGLAKGVNPRAVNTVFVGAAFKIMGLPTEEAEEAVKEHFADKESVIEDNLTLLKEGYEAVEQLYNLKDLGKKDDRMVIDGNSAVGLGALLAGLSYYAAYPMSPSTGILHYVASKQEELGIVVEQAEDEIAAINMALGGTYSGLRSMTGTSGGGLALMAEGIGLAGVAETPIVIADVQRPGPATGLPTRTGQGDLLFAVNIAQDEFPLMVLAPKDQEDAVYQTFRAFNLADKYQLPVIILSDQFIGDGSKTIKEIDTTDMKIERHLVDPAEVEGEYKRYKYTEDGISPRAYPGQLEGNIVLSDSDEHDEFAHIVEDAETRNKMVAKRSKKVAKLKEEDLLEPDYYGPEDPDYILVGWGSTAGPLTEARKLLADEYKVGHLAFNDVWPLPTKEIEAKAASGAKLVYVENNAGAQFDRLVRSETGIKADYNILKDDGRPFSGQEIYRRFKEEVSK
ncbi:2-oxoglutarate ferredoxin oxidoreductase subunit alpha [Halanaerobium congolense]|uniref:2-oxoglutarate ferredoxin oxidoreductase subunit alpha n=1 Tax=Halanaerobium congolense TaxID=54121 RepID=A0A1H9Y5I6_9FIRM|nr:2-oxoacid:acceptor oxidoreductase subunit alpha [Halanaerobium congolense]PTX16673.1 2-oxoglutarate ferredoxin oxidoreductase subunit alpha [Halanaerobium congolense]SDE83811.1 2-oxoglutarate ferredoxin oxidoreductase subunit alpha [Halanaerobium congolense]SES64062.1 2-oxoglutarate ferredoxin oxidoreductase subunit alpha [Halanaerobium congolense]SFO91627.1 2-oxoglutarate ferredoxin oxidoreductase subunit alpha [Halanaerobium congolense]